ncbi:MAG: cytochrome c [Acidobacteriota bacterium]
MNAKTFLRGGGVWAGRGIHVFALAFLLLASVGCRQDMHNQYKFEVYEENPFFENGMSSRPPLPHTVARGQLVEDPVLHTGLTESLEPSPSYPFEIDRAALYRGQRRYEQICSPCHDRVGSGNGMIVQRGYKQPTSFHDPRLRAEMPGYFVSVMTKGYGQMGAYAHILSVHDRWRVAAYIQALQLSQSARAVELTAEDLEAVATNEVAAHGGNDYDGDGSDTGTLSATGASPSAESNVAHLSGAK